MPGHSSLSAPSAAGPKNLDGGGSVAADPNGHVYVVWHAAGIQEGEPHRTIYVSASADDGARFAPERAFANQGGACGCCGIATLVDARGRLQVLYRAAGDGIHRDAMWMTLGPQGAAAPIRLQPWELPACPMTTFAMAAAPDGIVAAWETGQQIYSALLDPDRRRIGTLAPMTGNRGPQASERRDQRRRGPAHRLDRRHGMGARRYARVGTAQSNRRRVGFGERCGSRPGLGARGGNRARRRLVRDSALTRRTLRRS